MKIHKLLYALAGCGLGFGVYAYAQVPGPTRVPRLIPYQGRVSQNGAAAPGPLELAFSIYDSPAAGTLLWGPETHAGVAIVGGRFAVTLGAITPLPDAIWDSSGLYLSISIGGLPLNGRQRLLTVPKAIRAANAEVAGTAEDASGPLRAELDTLGPRNYTHPGTGRRYSLGAVPCGLSTQATSGSIVSGALTGYAAAKAICESTCGQLTAHMCTSEEMIRFVASGGAGAGMGWIATGGFAISPNGRAFSDCLGFTDASSGANFQSGTLWGSDSPAWADCNEVRPIHCCN